MTMNNTNKQKLHVFNATNISNFDFTSTRELTSVTQNLDRTANTTNTSQIYQGYTEETLNYTYNLLSLKLFFENSISVEFIPSHKKYLSLKFA